MTGEIEFITSKIGKLRRIKSAAVKHRINRRQRDRRIEINEMEKAKIRAVIFSCLVNFDAEKV
jgi:hypothetical protein